MTQAQTMKTLTILLLIGLSIKGVAMFNEGQAPEQKAMLEPSITEQIEPKQNLPTEITTVAKEIDNIVENLGDIAPAAGKTEEDKPDTEEEKELKSEDKKEGEPKNKVQAEVPTENIITWKETDKQALDTKTPTVNKPKNIAEERLPEEGK